MYSNYGCTPPWAPDLTLHCNVPEHVLCLELKIKLIKLNVFKNALNVKLHNVTHSSFSSASLPRVSDGTSGVWMQVVLFNRQENWLLKLVFLQHWCKQVPYLQASKVEPGYQLYRSASKLRPLLAFCGHNKNMSQKSANAKSFPCVKCDTKTYVKLKYSTAFLTRALWKVDCARPAPGSRRDLV